MILMRSVLVLSTQKQCSRSRKVTQICTYHPALPTQRQNRVNPSLGCGLRRGRDGRFLETRRRSTCLRVISFTPPSASAVKQEYDKYNQSRIMYPRLKHRGVVHGEASTSFLLPCSLIMFRNIRNKYNRTLRYHQGKPTDFTHEATLITRVLPRAFFTAEGAAN